MKTFHCDYLYLQSGRVWVRKPGKSMVINDNIRNCVAFIASKSNSDYCVRATAFFVMHPVEGTSHISLYAVTAAHAVRELSEHDGNVHLRLNLKGGGVSWIPVPKNEWEFHSDSNVDIAVWDTAWGESEFLQHDHLALGSSEFVTKEKASEISPGGDLFFPGLLTHYVGLEKNIPIIRRGTVAAIPGDPIRLKGGYRTAAYLAELRSIGGHSGSPVFFQARPFVLGSSVIGASTFMIGLVHGHFPRRERKHVAYIPLETAESAFGDEEEDFNSGICIIMPAWEIMSVLNQSRLVEQRRLEREQMRAAQPESVPDA